MAAEEHDTRLAQFVESAKEDRANRVAVEPVFRKACDGQRGQRASAHRVDVADGIGRGNLAVHVRIVHDRREEIDRLHDRGSALPPVHTRIVRSPEIDQDPIVSGCRDGAQHLSELASGEFARSTGAGDHLRQTLGHVSFLSFVAGPHPRYLCLRGFRRSALLASTFRLVLSA